MSNEAQAGESSTTSPSRAARARGVDRVVHGLRVLRGDPGRLERGGGSRTRSSPMRTARRTRPRAAAASGAKSWPLPLPPAIRTTGSGKLSSALIVESTLVPLESL